MVGHLVGCTRWGTFLVGHFLGGALSRWGTFLVGHLLGGALGTWWEGQLWNKREGQLRNMQKKMEDGSCVPYRRSGSGRRRRLRGTGGRTTQSRARRGIRRNQQQGDHRHRSLRRHCRAYFLYHTTYLLSTMPHRLHLLPTLPYHLLYHTAASPPHLLYHTASSSYLLYHTASYLKPPLNTAPAPPPPPSYHTTSYLLPRLTHRILTSSITPPPLPHRLLNSCTTLPLPRTYSMTPPPTPSLLLTQRHLLLLPRPTPPLTS